MPDTTFREFSQRIGRNIGPNPFCVETGASYTTADNQENMVHTTTYNLVWYITKPNGGMLWTYDFDLGNLEICRRVLAQDVLYWKAVVGDSVEQLSKADFPRSIDFVHFDSGGAPELMVAEFEAVEPYLSPNAVVCCDDIHNASSVKWVDLVPLLKTKARYSLELSTGLGTFVAFMGETLGGY